MGSVSTWMGDRLGIPSVVGSPFVLFGLLSWKVVSRIFSFSEVTKSFRNIFLSVPLDANTQSCRRFDTQNQQSCFEPEVLVPGPLTPGSAGLSSTLQHQRRGTVGCVTLPRTPEVLFDNQM